MRFGRYDDRIGVVIGVEKVGNDQVLLVRTPQNVLYGQEHDFVTPDMAPRPASERELIEATIALRDRATRDIDAYLARFQSLRPSASPMWRLMASLALLTNAGALAVLASSGVPVVAVLAAAVAFVAVIAAVVVMDSR